MNVLHRRIRLLLVSPSFYATVASYSVFLFHYSQTNDLVTIVHKLINQPLKRICRVFVFVKPTQKRPGPFGVFVVFVLSYQGEGALLDEVCWLVERIERNAGLKVPAEQS